MSVHRRRQLAVTIAVLSLVVATCLTPPAHAGKPSTVFFGTIERAGGDQLDELRKQLVRVGDECTEVGKRCPAAEELFDTVTRGMSVRELPIHIVYVDADGHVQTNAMFWKRKLTPYLWSVQSVWSIVFIEHEIPLGIQLSALWQKGRGASGTAGGVFVTEGQRTMDAREAQRYDQLLKFDVITGKAEDDRLWYASQQFFIEPMSAYRITINPVDSNDPEVGFRVIQANFSNSTKTSTFGAVGLGATFNLDEQTDTSSGVQVGSTRINPYLMIQFDIIRPVLVKPIGESITGRYRPSVGLAAGVNLKFWETEEIIFGVNFGYLWGTVGVTAGINIIDPFTGSDEESETEVRPYLGVDFRF